MKLFKLYVLILVIIGSMMLAGCESFLNNALGDTSGTLGEDDLGDDAGIFDADDNKHDCEVSEWTVVSDSTCSDEGEKVGICDICLDTVTAKIPRLPHTPIYADAVEASCSKEGRESGEYCSVCNVIISGLRVLEKKQHTVVVDPAVEATETTPGKTEGSHCSSCGLIIVRQQYTYSDNYSTPAMYSGSYAYDYLLSNYENGDDMQAFYRDIDESMEYFHSSTIDAQSKVVSGKTLYYAAEIDFAEHSLNSDEAIAVWSAYRMDHPLYYWMSNLVSHVSGLLTVGVYEEYVDGDVRIDYNSRLYNEIERYVEDLDGRGSEYQIALSFHDNIILSANYAYEDDGG